MRGFHGSAALLALALFTAGPAAAQMNETPMAPPDAPHNPTATGTPRPPPRHPDQTTLANQARTQDFKDPSIPRADETPQQQALPDHTIAH